MRKRKELASEEKVSLVEDGKLDQPVSFRGCFRAAGKWKPGQVSVQLGSKAQGGGGISVGPGQFYVHCGKVSTVLGKSGIGLGEGVS